MITLIANDTTHAQANWLRSKGYNVSQLLREHLRMKAVESGWNDPASVSVALLPPTEEKVKRSL